MCVIPVDISWLSLVKGVEVTVRWHAVKGVVWASVRHSHNSLSAGKLSDWGLRLHHGFGWRCSEDEHLLAELGLGEGVVVVAGVFHLHF